MTGHTTDAVPADQEPPARATASRLLRHPWRLLLPALPDVIALLVAQGELTITGMDAFEAWSTRGDPDAAAAVRTAQHQAYEARRQLLTALQTALSTPIDQEDLYLLSERIDHVMNMARNTVREGEVLTWSPDTAASQMGARLAAGARALVDGFRLLVKDPDQAGKQADAASDAVHHVEGDYRRAMAELLRMEDLRAVLTAQDLYRRYLQVAQATDAVADRLWYAVLRGA